MHSILSPIGTEILIPESLEENDTTFLSSQLSEARNYLLDNGYVVIRRAISPNVCDSLRDAFSKTVKASRGYIYRQTTQNPERNSLNGCGFVMNPILNLQSLRSDFAPLKSLAVMAFSSDTVKAFTKTLFSEDAKLVQSMYFEGNSETWPHQDTYYLDSERIGTMVGAWYALEDINAGAGRFFVVPGTHKVDMVKNGGDVDVAFNHDRYKSVVKRLISGGEFDFRAPCLAKGDVLFWNSRTIHGSLRTTRPQFSRSSLTAHYIPSSHRFLQFQSRIRSLHLREFNGMFFHCPKDMERLSNRIVMHIETTFPKTFQTVKRLAIKALVR
jgi:phytanoyl-CoA hydroxylase